MNGRGQGVILIIAGIFAGALSALSPGSVFFIILAAVTVFFLGRGRKSEAERRFLVTLFISAFVLRVIFSLLLMGGATFSGHTLNYACHTAPDYTTPYVFDDSGYYTLRGQFISMHLQGLPLNKKTISDFITIAYGANGFNYILAAYFTLFGWSPFSSRFINCFFGSLTAIIVYFMVKSAYGSEKIARLAAILTAFFPSLFLWSTVNLKEPVFMFVVCVMLWAMIMFQKSGKISYLCVAALSLFLQDFIRPGYREFIYLSIALLLFYLVLVAVVHLVERRRYLFIVCVLLGLCVLSFMLRVKLAHIYDGLVNRAVIAQRGALSLPGIHYQSAPDHVLATGKAGPIGFMAMFVKSWLHFIFEPLPWQIKSKSLLMVLPETYLVYLMMPFAALGIAVSLRHKLKESFMLWGYYLFIGSIIAIISANIGTMLRLRGLVIPLFLIFVSVGLARVFSRPGTADT